MSEAKKEIKVVKATQDATAENIVAAASGHAKVNQKFNTVKDRMNKKGDGVWALTVLYLHDLKALDSYDSTKKVEDLAEEIRFNFKTAFMDEYEVPERGLNARTGKDIKLTGKDGELKWSSWEGTKLPIAYCGDIAKVIAGGVVDKLIVSDDEVAARCDILREAKPTETPFGSCQRGVKLIADNYEALNDLELDGIVAELLALYGNAGDRLSILRKKTGTDA